MVEEAKQNKFQMKVNGMSPEDFQTLVAAVEARQEKDIVTQVMECVDQIDSNLKKGCKPTTVTSTTVICGYMPVGQTYQTKTKVFRVVLNDVLAFHVVAKHENPALGLDQPELVELKRLAELAQQNNKELKTR